MKALRVAVFASGRGTNLRAIQRAIAAGELSCDLVLVVSDCAGSGALELARKNDIAVLHIHRGQFDSDAEFDQRLLEALRAAGAEIIALAGYLRKISPAIVREYRNRILNIHPALLPAFGGKGMYGLKVHQAVLEYGCKVSGVTVHLVDEEYDAGPPVLQACVPVEAGDTAETLAARVLRQEHKLYSRALQLFAEGRVRIQGRRVTIKPSTAR